jgi:SAM-dependent methyltransferase
MTTSRRRNLAFASGEGFKPPVFKPNNTVWNRAGNWLRRWVDLQAGSVWESLRGELALVKGRLLDIGCGAQIYRSLVPPDVIYRGIDTSDAKTRFGYDVPDTEYFEGDEWPVSAGAFDTALCTEVLEHVPSPRNLLAQVHRSLRPGGRLLMTVPFAARWHFIPHDYWRFTPSGLSLLLQEGGFEDIVIQSRGNPLTVACYKGMALPLMLLFGGSNPFAKVGGVLLLPLLALLAAIGNLSLKFDWGDDCLGYTILARKSADAAAPAPSVGAGMGGFP